MKFTFFSKSEFLMNITFCNNSQFMMNLTFCTQPPIQWVPGDLSLGVKRPRLEADRSPPSNAEVKECMELYLHFPNTSSWRGAQLKNYRDNFTFTFTFTLPSEITANF
jgi:hypothetical protein